jgi:acetyltransferase-like isoleucine patch superfamily enzyme
MEAVAVTKRLLDLLSHRRVFHAVWQGRRWTVGGHLVLERGARLEPYASILAGHILPREMGAFSYSHSQLGTHVAVGRYCSLAERISWMGQHHPVDWAMTSSAAYDNGPLQSLTAYFADIGTQPTAREYPQKDPRITIGHDVWIGDEAMIAPGVTIGHGAVIGARSLVLKDVPPYAVAVGTPARIQRMRFPEALVERFLAANWWQYRPDVVRPLPVEDPARFLDALDERLVSNPPKPMNPIPLTGGEILATASSAAAE